MSQSTHEELQKIRALLQEAQTRAHYAQRPLLGYLIGMSLEELGEEKRALQANER